MSNYLRGLGRAVSIMDDAARQVQADDTARDYDWENLSQGSGRRDTNLLRGDNDRERGEGWVLPSTTQTSLLPPQLNGTGINPGETG